MTDNERVIATVESICGPIPSNVGQARGVPLESLDKAALLAVIHLSFHQHKHEIEFARGDAEMRGIFKALGI